ncbi:MAG TPA: MoxR family ATPase [Clostridia bacterium]|nr:MoxR family ATPase [Clostridia bacterium]
MFKDFYENIDKVILGKKNVAEQLMIALLAEGHVLIEDVPGVGKTTMAKALAFSLDASFSRIQFTPDVLPSDILGVSIYNQKEQIFKFQKGPIFNQIILSDEINRASPKTQSSLLEAMEEKQVTIDGKTYILQEPFMVVATQNPIEYEGTFALPQAQLDRFMMKIEMGYPSKAVEMDIFLKIKEQRMPEKLGPIFTTDEIINMRQKVNDIYMAESVKEYIFNIVRETRADDDIILGLSTRAAIALYKASKAKAFIEGRAYVTPRDIKTLAKNVFSHRVIIKPEKKYQGITNREFIENIVRRTPVPKETDYAK